jgi:hypothetical protein
VRICAGGAGKPASLPRHRTPKNSMKIEPLNTHGKSSRSKDGHRLHSAHNPKVVSSNLTPATKKFLPFNNFREPRNHPN